MERLNKVLEEGYNQTLRGDIRKQFLQKEKSIKILDCNYSKYYYDDDSKTLFKGTIDGRNNFTNFYKIRLKEFEIEINNLLESKSNGYNQGVDINDIKNALEIIKKHKEAIMAKECEYFERLAYAALAEVDENVAWKIQCNGSTKNDVKRKKKTR